MKNKKYFNIKMNSRKQALNAWTREYLKLGEKGEKKEILCRCMDLLQKIDRDILRDSNLSAAEKDEILCCNNTHPS